MKKYLLADYCERDGCFCKPSVILMYKGYPLQLCKDCANDEQEREKNQKKINRQLKKEAAKVQS